MASKSQCQSWLPPGKAPCRWRHFFPGKFGGELLLLSLAQDSERHFRSFGESLQELSQLTRLDQNLVVQHFEDVVLLNASSSSGAVRLYIIDNQPEAFRQTKLITHDCWHLRCVHTEIGDRNLRTFLVMTWHSRFVMTRHSCGAVDAAVAAAVPAQAVFARMLRSATTR